MMKKPIYANCVWTVFEDAMFVSDKMQERNGVSTHYPIVSYRAEDDRLLLVVSDLVGLKEKYDGYQRDIRICFSLKQAARLSKRIKRHYKQPQSVKKTDELPSWRSGNNIGGESITGYGLGSVKFNFIIGDRVISSQDKDRWAKVVAYYSGSNAKEADQYEVILHIDAKYIASGMVSEESESGDDTNDVLAIPPCWKGTKGSVEPATIIIEMKSWMPGKFAATLDKCIATINSKKEENEQNA